MEASRRSAFAANDDFVFFMDRKASVNASFASGARPDIASSIAMVFLIGMIFHWCNAIAILYKRSS